MKTRLIIHDRVDKSDAAVASTLAAYQAGYASILDEIHQTLPGANLLVLGYFNPFPADPTNPATPLFTTCGMPLNGIIRGLATQYGGTFVDTAPPFVGREAAPTYLARMPRGSSSPNVGPYVGIEPVGNVHPNDAGYQAIAGQVEAAAVPEPASIALLATGCLCQLVASRGRKPAVGRD